MKEKHQAREPQKKERKDQSPNKRPHLKVQNAQGEALEEKVRNLGPNTKDFCHTKRCGLT
jgi:hypothetical protein